VVSRSDLFHPRVGASLTAVDPFPFFSLLFQIATGFLPPVFWRSHFGLPECEALPLPRRMGSAGTVPPLPIFSRNRGFFPQGSSSGPFGLPRAAPRHEQRLRFPTHPFPFVRDPRDGCSPFDAPTKRPSFFRARSKAFPGYPLGTFLKRPRAFSGDFFRVQQRFPS